MHVRDATAADAEACAAIYAPYVTDTAITFELEVPSAAAMAERIERVAQTHAWLVAEAGGIGGYAGAGPYKERAAYRWSCAVSVYVDRGRQRRRARRARCQTL